MIKVLFPFIFLFFMVPVHAEDAASLRLDSWQKLIQTNQKLTDHEKLEIVNRFFNLQEHQPDTQVWNKKDYWATPKEFLMKGQGDCEDFVIGKYFTLIALGVSEQKLFLIYVKMKKADGSEIPHMVLGYYTGKEDPLILDNFNKEILQLSNRTDLSLVYRFNEQGLWRENKQIGQAKDLKQWVDLQRRLLHDND